MRQEEAAESNVLSQTDFFTKPQHVSEDQELAQINVVLPIGDQKANSDNGDEKGLRSESKPPNTKSALDKENEVDQKPAGLSHSNSRSFMQSIASQNPNLNVLGSVSLDQTKVKSN